MSSLCTPWCDDGGDPSSRSRCVSIDVTWCHIIGGSPSPVGHSPRIDASDVGSGQSDDSREQDRQSDEYDHNSGCLLSAEGGVQATESRTW